MKALRILNINQFNITLEKTNKPVFHLCFRYCSPLFNYMEI